MLLDENIAAFIEAFRSRHEVSDRFVLKWSPSPRI